MKGEGIFLNKKNLNIIIAVVGCIVILTIGGLVFNQIHNNYLANQLIMEKCFDNFDEVREVVIKKEGFLSTVSCEKSSNV